MTDQLPTLTLAIDLAEYYSYVCGPQTTLQAKETNVAIHTMYVTSQQSHSLASNNYVDVLKSRPGHQLLFGLCVS